MQLPRIWHAASPSTDVALACMRVCRHPVSVALEDVTAAREAFVAKSSSEHASSLVDALRSLQALLQGSEVESQAQALSGMLFLLRQHTTVG